FHPYSVSTTAPSVPTRRSSDLFGVSFTDVAPTVTADHASVSAAENAPAANTGAFADFDDAVTITASSGTVTQSGSQSGTWSWTGSGDEDHEHPAPITAANPDQP